MSCKKRLLLLIILFLSIPSIAHGSDFTTSLDTIYTVTDASLIQVKQIVSVTNNTAIRFPTSFELTIPGNIHTPIQVTNTNGKPAQFETERGDRYTRLTLLFTEPIVGLDKNQTYTIEYQNPSVLFGSFPITQFALPPFPNLSSSVITNTKLIVSEQMCPHPTTYPKTSSTETNNRIHVLNFSSSPPTQSIFIRCADKRYVSIALHYYLTNSNMTPIETQITLPPDTEYQHFYYDEINPSPLSIVTDNDGNVIAGFRLEPKEAKKITVNANALISALPLHTPMSANNTYLSPQPFWPISNPEIKNLSKPFSDAESVYRALMATTVLDQTTINKRLGGDMVIVQPLSLQPIDLIDGFITLNRSKGIMSRRLIGFVQSPDSALWPTTLLENTLHLWADYYDNNQNQWIQVDPLWEKTSRSNFFPIHDLNHIVLAINGSDDTIPYPVGYYQSPENTGPDIQITNQEPFIPPPPQIEATINTTLPHLLGVTPKTQLRINNRGLFSLYDETVTLLIDNEAPQTVILHRLPLQGHAIIPINLPNYYEKASLTIGGTSIPITSTKSTFAKPLVFAPILAGISGILAVFTRRLLVSRRH